MRTKVIETSRLLLRPFELQDAEPFIEIHQDPEVVEFVNGGRAQLPHQGWEQMAAFVGHWQLLGYGPWAIEERMTGSLVGWAGILFPTGWPQPELGWTLGRRWWGLGYATEAARRAMDWAFTELGLVEVVSYIDARNQRSIAVARRIGELEDGSVAIAESIRSRYVRSRDDWKRDNRPQ